MTFYRVEQTSTVVFFIEAQDRDEASDILDDMWNDEVIANRLDIRDGVEYTTMEESLIAPNEDMSWVVFITEEDDIAIR